MDALVVDEALPADLHGLLADQLLHGNRAPYVRKAYWFPVDGVPRLVVEHALVRLRAYVPSQNVEGVEWWVMSRPAERGMGFHCDPDGRPNARLHFASVLFFDHVGGPTLVLDQTTSADGASMVPPRAQTGVALLPAPNRFGLFPGDLQHGVASQASPPGVVRTSLVMNWWTGWTVSEHCSVPPYDQPDFVALRPPAGRAWPESSPGRRILPVALGPSYLEGLPEHGNTGTFSAVPVWPGKTADRRASGPAI